MFESQVLWDSFNRPAGFFTVRQAWHIFYWRYWRRIWIC